METPEDHVKRLLAELAAIPDPAERAKQAATVIERARTELMAGARKIRQDAVNELRAQGLSHAEVGNLIGQTRSRAQQISEGRTGGKPKAKIHHRDGDPRNNDVGNLELREEPGDQPS